MEMHSLCTHLFPHIPRYRFNYTGNTIHNKATNACSTVFYCNILPNSLENNSMADRAEVHHNNINTNNTANPSSPKPVSFAIYVHCLCISVFSGR